MLKRFVLLISLLCLLLCAAAASASGGRTLIPVDLADCTVNPLPGVVFDSRTSYQDGRIILYIDSADSDFSQLVASSYSPEGNMVSVSGVITAPNGESAYKTFFTDSKNEQKIWDEVLGQWPNKGGIAGSEVVWTWDLGTYDPDKQLFIPYDTEDYPYNIVIGWKNEDGEFVPHRMILEVHYTSAEPQDASLSMLPMDNIQSGSAVSAGRVEHVCAKDSSSVTTRFTLPGIEGVPAGSAVTVHQTGSTASPVTLTPDSSGVYVLETSLTPGAIAVTEAAYLIEQFDSSGCPLARYSLSVSVAQGNPQFWPTYIDNDILKPFDPGRIRYGLSEAVPGLAVSYQNGHLRFKTDAATFAPASQGNLADVWGVVDLIPPAGAAKMGYAGTADDIICGDFGDSLPSPSVFETVSWETFGAGAPFFTEVPYEDEAQSYYASFLEYTGKYSGAVSFYFWYEEGAAEPFLIEYIVRTHDPVSFETSTPVVDSESDLPAADVGKPFLVVQDKGTTQKTLSANLYPTGENKHYYEIRVMNKNGKEVPLNNASCKLYLPYPPGYDEANAHLLSFTICHYNKKGSDVKERYSLESGNLELTPYGLCIIVGDFSPFTVEWTEATDALSPAALPQTGDHSRLTLWALMLLATIPFLARRMRRSA